MSDLVYPFLAAAQFHWLLAAGIAIVLASAILAVAASMLTAAYYMLRDGVEYRDLGPLHFDRRDKAKTIRRLVRRLSDLGCDVEVKAHAA